MEQDQFWKLTPYEFHLIFEGYQERKVERLNEILYHAWHIEAFSRQKKLPKLENIYVKKGKQKASKNKTGNNDKLIELAKRKGLNGFWNCKEA